MRIGVLGINHKSSELSFQELLARACRKRLCCDEEISQRLSCVVLSTCNRTEVYFSSNDLAAAHSELLQTLREEIDEPFEHKLYTYFGADCFTHLALVTAGLDSMILVESEIQRQVRIAYENTALYYRLPSCMHYLFQKCLQIGKQVRSSIFPPTGHTSLSGMIWQIGQWVFNSTASKRVLFIGNSEINRKTLLLLKRKGVHQISLCTRSPASAEELKSSHQVTLIDWTQLSSWKQFDWIICGTHAPDYLISCQDLRSNVNIDSDDALERMTPKLILDLSVPRNVEPALARHPQITLLNMEEVGHLIERKEQRDCIEVQRMEAFVWDRVRKHVLLFHQKETKALLHCVLT
jgi:glutamyl-tRNA reductase